MLILYPRRCHPGQASSAAPEYSSVTGSAFANQWRPPHPSSFSFLTTRQYVTCIPRPSAEPTAGLRPPSPRALGGQGFQTPSCSVSRQPRTLPEQLPTPSRIGCFTERGFLFEDQAWLWGWGVSRARLVCPSGPVVPARNPACVSPKLCGHPSPPRAGCDDVFRKDTQHESEEGLPLRSLPSPLGSSGPKRRRVIIQRLIGDPLLAPAQLYV
jgi:hypothetical protein